VEGGGGWAVAADHAVGLLEGQTGTQACHVRSRRGAFSSGGGEHATAGRLPPASRPSRPTPRSST
jgi:hypothetical protein